MPNLFSKDCQVCNQQKAKYKCPTCSILYCSLTCNKSHKASEVCVKKYSEEEKIQNEKKETPLHLTSFASSSSQSSTSVSTAKLLSSIPSTSSLPSLPKPLSLPDTPISELDPTARDYVSSLSEEALQRLANHPTILQALQKEHLQSCILHIDSAQEKDREHVLIEALLHNAEFSQFAETCLQVIKQ